MTIELILGFGTSFSGSPFSSEFAVVTFNPDSDSHLRGSVSNPFTDGDIHSQDFFGTGLQVSVVILFVSF